MKIVKVQKCILFKMEIEQYLKLYHINNTFGEIEKTQTPISKISSGEIFGDELMGHRENSQFSVKVESLDAKQTFKRVLNELKTYCTEKYQYLDNRAFDILALKK